ncbi:hypothetical protein Ahy_B10g100902 [Arachis hypogaea]|uniref:non-specific serine/threonine protein kinase n=1 Tax=Arachis hypogaea TaxID=3818 RepID=A0A444WXX4_ARAHY|nr:hypothetical protein Ahy_B10g100902 [Arachis hypogaea]
MKIDYHGLPEALLRRNQTIIYRTGPWNGERFSGIPGMKDNTNDLKYNFSYDEHGVWFSFSVTEPSLLSRIILSSDSDGQYQRYMWIQGRWNKFSYTPKDPCDYYRQCGPYGVCENDASPICTCMQGFRPKNQEAWNLRDGSDGCVRNTVLNCSTDKFLHLENMKLPETSNVFINKSMTLDECGSLCKRNCSCTAYANIDIRNGGSGCVMWFDQLFDMNVHRPGGQDLYVRLAAADIGSTSSNKNHRAVLAIGITLSALVLVLGLIAICYLRKKRQQSSRGDERNMDDLKLPMFNFDTLMMATNNFSQDNKLGEGGFGSVYRGRLIEGQEIAVKRLSENSGQGINEFKNEIKLIAKLQHRNLVRLLGCCIEKNEKMVIYEYMKNRGLDSILFGTFLFCSGYMSPEYIMDGNFSIKSDIYSFGVMILEIITGKKNRGFSGDNDELNLLENVWRRWHEGTILTLIDPSIGNSYTESEILRCIHVGLLCVQECAEDRPTMSSVILMLSSEAALMSRPSNPGFFLRRNHAETSSRNQDNTESVNQIYDQKEYKRSKLLYDQDNNHTLLDYRGLPEIFLRTNQTIIYQTGPWNGERFSGVPEMDTDTHSIVFSFSDDAHGAFYSFSIGNASLLSRLTVTSDSDGELQRRTWIESSESWNKFWYKPADQCDHYRECGPYGVCDNNASPVCTCMKGFSPKNPQAWNLRDGSGGCVRNTDLNCSTDKFLHLENMKLPETSSVFINKSMTLDECGSLCKRNCSCTAYANIDIRNGGSGCVMWIGQLFDMNVYHTDGQDLYVRLAAADIGSTSSSKNRRAVLATGITLSALVLVLGVVAICYLRKKRQQSSRGDERNMEDLKLPMFDFDTLTMATNNFSQDNKLGEGGFGIVYRGRLIEGQEIAIKRLSENSGQGINEFKNEIKLIAKLQHRNLVRLLGCCIEKNEKMVVYEYMENRGLDSIFFGVMVLEIITGKKNRRFSGDNDELNLLENVWRRWHEGTILTLVDSSIGNSYAESEVLRCIHVGLLCVQECAEDRPTMSSVVLMLSSEAALMPRPRNPGFFLRRNHEETSSRNQDKTESVNQVTVTLLNAR